MSDHLHRLLAFSCNCRYCYLSWHAKRLAVWTQWLEATLLAPVLHRPVVLTIPQRLRAYCLYRRRLSGRSPASPPAPSRRPFARGRCDDQFVVV